MSTQNPDELRLRAKLGARAHAVQELEEIHDTLSASVEAIQNDPYLTDEERTLQLQRARDEAANDVTAKIRAAREAHEELRETAAAVLNRHKPSAQAVQTVRHLLEQGSTLASIAERGRELGEPELVVAARAESKLLPSSNRGDPKAFLESKRLAQALDQHLGAVIPGSERDALLEALKFSQHDPDPVIEAAGKLAVKGAYDSSGVPMARMALGFAKNEVERAGSSDDDDGGAAE